MLDLAIWLARTVVTSVVPPILIPLNAAFFNATVGSSPFHMLMAKVMEALTPKAEREMTAPDFAS